MNSSLGRNNIQTKKELFLLKGIFTIIAGILLFSLYPIPSRAQNKTSKYAIIPYPVKLIEGEGYFTISPKTGISIPYQQSGTRPIWKVIARY